MYHINLELITLYIHMRKKRVHIMNTYFYFIKLNKCRKCILTYKNKNLPVKIVCKKIKLLIKNVILKKFSLTKYFPRPQY